MLRLKVTTVGESLGVVLPEEVLARFKAKEGDELALIETPEGYALTAWDPDFARCMETGREITRRYGKALRALAKG